MQFDLEKMFRFEFYNYGSIYYLLNVLVTASFNLLERYDLAIYAPHVLNDFLSVLNLWVIYKISNLYLSHQRSIFLVFFGILGVYFLCLNSFAFGEKYILVSRAYLQLV